MQSAVLFMITPLRPILAIAIFAVIGCADRPTRMEPPGPSAPGPSIAIGTLRGTVDVAAGTMTFAPVATPLALRGSLGGISAAIYGNQGSTVRFYNSTVVVSAPVAGKKTFSANVGIENFLAYPIGDEQVGAVPQDTIGIYAFVNSDPTVVSTSSACSPACTVTVQNYHGTLTFNAPSQKYWHWPERLGAFGTATDTTRLRKAWVFQADTQVRIFSFDILVSATWPPANETRWRLEYPGDSAPHTAAEPRWRRNAGSTGTNTLNTPTAGIITLTTPIANSQYFTRLDSMSSTSNAYMEARFRTNSATVFPEVTIAMDDDTKFIGVGLSGTRVGFLNSIGGFAPPSFLATTTTFHTYQIRKFGADSAQLWMDGARLDSRTYSTFPNSIGTSPALFTFGGPGTGAPPLSTLGNVSAWDWVIVEKGVTQP
jgi:hypothetical protein